MITSLHSPHVERVKALLGSRGNKARRQEKLFVAEGLQSIREALASSLITTQAIYVTEHGRQLLAEENLISEDFDFVDVSDAVMAAMTDTVTPQGVLALCEIPKSNKSEFFAHIRQPHPIRIAYFWQIQDPGNAGTVIRTADAFGCNAVMFSPGSVDVFSPKVVRSTVGSLWHIPIFEDVEPHEIVEISGAKIFVTDGAGELELAAAVKEQGNVAMWVFGNEARGVSDLPAELLSRAQTVAIPMSGGAESLNIASAASIVLYSASLST